MAGGSQLKQLKASLKQNGLIGQTNGGKKGKRPHSKHDRKDRDKVIQSIREAFNPFDVKVNRQKSDVLGRNVTGATGKPGISKQIGEENRRRAYEVMSKKNKAGGVIDRRFGENDKDMTPEEVMLARFTKEKLTGLGKKESLFNLDDGEEDVLTHYGQSLSMTDDFQEDDLGLDEEEEGLVRRRGGDEEGGYRGGREEGDERPKSKKEVMQEVIAKSKMYKYERQQAKEEDLNIIDELDAQENIDSLLEDLNSFDKSYNGKKQELTERDQEYEQRLREMAFDRRAKPTDRTKTDEELEKERSEKIRKLEQQRIERMEGRIYEDEDDIGGDEQEEEGDEEDEDNDAAEFGLDVKNFSDDYVSDEDDEEDEEGDSEDEEGSEIDVDDRDSIQEKPAKRQKTTQPTYICPKTLPELTTLFSNKSINDYPVIIDRILDLYHPSKAEGNKQKIGILTQVLFEFLQTTINHEDGYPKIFNKLVEQLRKLSNDHVESLTEYCREKLVEANEQFTTIRNGKSSATPSDLLLFTLIGLVFSTSDHFHLVVTSAGLILSQHLSQCPIRGLNDLLTDVFICDTLLAYQRISHRYVPEITLFLEQLLVIYSPKDQQTTIDILNVNEYHYQLDTKTLTNLPTPSFLSLNDFTSPSPDINEKIFLHSLNLISTTTNIWRDKSAFVEIFSPISALLKSYDNIHPTVISTQSRLDKLISTSSNEKTPLSLQSHRPVPIQTHAPKFEENYNVDRKSYDPDRERNETKKLKAELKKERKGALRDLRRDNAFVSREKIKTKRQSDKEYHDKLARLERTIQTEEGAEKNKYERERQARKRKH